MPALVTSSKHSVHWQSKYANWETPSNLLNLIGPIELDPCTNYRNPTSAESICLAPDEYDSLDGSEIIKYCDTVARDGLSQDWRNLFKNPLNPSGLVYINPPYGKGVIDWINKGYQSELQRLYLLPSRTDVKWFQFVKSSNNPATICFMQKRLKFKGAKDPAPFPSVLLYWPSPHEPSTVDTYFKARFSGCGAIL